MGAVVGGSADLDGNSAHGHATDREIGPHGDLRSGTRPHAGFRWYGLPWSVACGVGAVAGGSAGLDRDSALGPATDREIRSYGDLRSGTRPHARLRGLRRALRGAPSQRRVGAVAGGSAGLDRDSALGPATDREIQSH